MATVKIKFRVSSIETKAGTLYYQVIHNRLVKQVHFGYKLYPSEWDADCSRVILSSGIEKGREGYLLSIEPLWRTIFPVSRRSSCGLNVPTWHIPPTKWWNCSPLRLIAVGLSLLHGSSSRN